MRRFESVRYRRIGILDDILHVTTITPCDMYNVDGDGIIGQVGGKGRKCFCDWGVDDRAVSVRTWETNFIWLFRGFAYWKTEGDG